jgi:hypothetical protein
MNLFVRPPEDLLGYIPQFSTEEACLFYRFKKEECIGGLGSFEEDDVRRISYQHSIQILDTVIYGKHTEEHSYYMRDKFDIAAEIANEYLQSSAALPAIKEWISKNAEQLNNDRRYWKARYHRKEIEDTEAKIKDLQEKVRRAWIVQSLYAF